MCGGSKCRGSVCMCTCVGGRGGETVHARGNVCILNNEVAVYKVTRNQDEGVFLKRMDTMVS